MSKRTHLIKHDSRKVLSPLTIILIFYNVLLLIGVGFLLTQIINQDNELKKLRKSIGITSTSDDINKKTFDLNNQEILKLVNEERGKNNLNPLVFNDALNQAACQKADNMIEKNYWSHNAPDGTEPWYFFDNVGYRYIKAGENLVYGYSNSSSLVDGWIESPSHHENMLGNYTETGICYKIARYQNGTNAVVVNLFGKR